MRPRKPIRRPAGRPSLTQAARCNVRHPCSPISTDLWQPVFVRSRRLKFELQPVPRVASSSCAAAFRSFEAL